ncbi:hypothetical protein KSS87_002035, partial [Heliosperma pusillum]
LTITTIRTYHNRYQYHHHQQWPNNKTRNMNIKNKWSQTK